MRCSRCGNENAEGNRFCGMCGGPLTAKTPVPPAARPASAPAAIRQPSVIRQDVRQDAVRQDAPAVSAPRPVAPAVAPSSVARPAAPTPVAPAKAPEISAAAERARRLSAFDAEADEPTISGPSFLGLNQPSPRRADGRDSGSLDYLLDDEEEPKRGWGKFVLIVVALALAGGFGYLRWKQGGFDWLTAGLKPAVTHPAADDAQKPTDNGGAAPTIPATGPNAGGVNAVPPGTASPNAAAGAAGTGAGSSGAATAPAGAVQNGGLGPSVPAGSAAAGTAPPNGSPATSQAASPSTSQSAISQSATSQSTSSPSSGPTDNPAQGSAAPSAAAAPGQSGAPSNSIEPITPPGTAAPAAASRSSEGEQSPAPSAVAPRRAAVRPAAPKPLPAKPVDAVTEADRYIYGRGVGQDCDRGLHMLKSAAEHSDAKAMIRLGALYSTGANCAPRDLPTAYRYFAMGLHKEPDNQALQDDLQKLWGQMTQPERQLAIKLSQ
ncbi:MAG: zinc-ribbon domain-containing protein [Candidatus Sulfotelmatobacter sp.]